MSESKDDASWTWDKETDLDNVDLSVQARLP